MEVLFHLIGIGGVSMSALAIFLKENGYNVQGSDLCESGLIKQLTKRNVKVFIGHNESNIDKPCVVVYSAAINADNPEIIKAKLLEYPVISRGELLGKISMMYENVIAVSGAHGKTTTTAMIAKIFEKAKLFPSVHVGGILKGYETNYILGSKKYFITEACEYKDNFLYLKPKFGVVLNVECEHLDYFKDFNHIKTSFKKFLTNCEMTLAPEGFSRNGQFLIDREFTAQNETYIHGKPKFDLFKNGVFFANIELRVCGKYNIYNASVAACVCDYFGISAEDISSGLKSFEGVKRRMETCQVFKNNVIFDYAHHPTEIKSSLETVCSFWDDFIVLFEPHTYSRTKNFFDNFLEVFNNFKGEIWLYKTYPAREPYDALGDSKTLFSSIVSEKKKYFENIDELLIALKSQNRNVLILGAGSLYDLINEKL